MREVAPWLDVAYYETKTPLVCSLQAHYRQLMQRQLQRGAPSRKHGGKRDERDRGRLKLTMACLRHPQNMSVVLRTAQTGR